MKVLGTLAAYAFMGFLIWGLFEGVRGTIFGN